MSAQQTPKPIWPKKSKPPDFVSHEPAGLGNKLSALSWQHGLGSGLKSTGHTEILFHRFGETEDATTAGIAVAANCGQIKIGRCHAPTVWLSTTS